MAYPLHTVQFGMVDAVTVPELPMCDLCKGYKARFDAKTAFGPWANMCWKCWYDNALNPGVTGTGIGQYLESQAEYDERMRFIAVGPVRERE